MGTEGLGVGWFSVSISWICCVGCVTAILRLLAGGASTIVDNFSRFRLVRRLLPMVEQLLVFC